jgi:nitroreductase
VDVFEAVRTRLEVKEFSGRRVPDEVRLRILEAARLSPSGRNSQHWRFVLVDGREALSKLADISFSGRWVAGADFAVIVITDPNYRWNRLDAGRAMADMQLVAWEEGVGSRIYTGFDERAMRDMFSIPPNMEVTAVVGFGYPNRRIVGRKDRLPLDRIAYGGRFGEPLRIPR